MTELSPRAILERLFRRWPLVALAIIIGGCVGLLASRLLPPVYEAHAEVFINRDSGLWAQEERIETTPEEALSNSVRSITELFYSDTIILGLIDGAAEENIPMDRNTFLTTFTIQRLYMTWQMTVRARDPYQAARLADLWVQVALPIHQSGHEHALSAFALTLQRDALATCFTGSSLSVGNACAGTSLATLSDLQPALLELDGRITADRSLSLGLDPAMTVEAVSPAAVPGSPVRFQRTWLTLAGAMIGLILGVVLVQGAFPKWKKNVAQG